MVEKMSAFHIDENAKPSGTCIWQDCDKPAVIVLGCTARPISMEVCANHGKMFLEDARIVSETDGVIGISISGTIDQDDIKFN